MGSIFISYRRGDSEGQAGRLFDDIVARFGKGSVFMDVEDIEPGRDFRQVIDQHVSSCGVLLALVGKGWLDATDDEGRRRLDDPNDFVRLETASALKRDIPVIPVLVQGASMPKADSLPEDIRAFAYRNAVELTHPRWESDVQLLIKALSRYAGDGGGNAQTGSNGRNGAVPGEARGDGGSGRANEPLQPDKVPWLTIVIAALIAAVFATGGYIIYDKNRKNDKEGQIAEPTAEMERIAAQKAADAQRAAVERADAERRAEEERIAAARAEAERAAAERAAREERAAAERRAAARAAAERERRAGAASANRVHSRGELAIAQTWAADLDEGRVGGAGADVWFEAVTATERYVTPRNGAKLGIVRGGGLPARETCATTRFSSGRISVDRLRQYPSVCVRTSSGRYAAFELVEPVGPSPGTLKIRYVCYE